MSADSNPADQRRAPRYSCERSAELFDADGTPHMAVLLNISEGGGQVALSSAVAAALGLPEAQAVPFRIWLPGDEEQAPLEGIGRVTYFVPEDPGSDTLRMGLQFQDIEDEGLARMTSFISICLRYAE